MKVNVCCLVHGISQMFLSTEWKPWDVPEGHKVRCQPSACFHSEHRLQSIDKMIAASQGVFLIQLAQDSLSAADASPGQKWLASLPNLALNPIICRIKRYSSLTGMTSNCLPCARKQQCLACTAEIPVAVAFSTGAISNLTVHLHQAAFMQTSSIFSHSCLDDHTDVLPTHSRKPLSY